ncbi:NADH:flavin oxidoreductase [Mycolicibacterium mucogenicum]|uniref:FAD-binding protein n=1 Tax=Mycolicibacterium mucogenicum DSM 44124 TaxID=1226753 RepID=A0A8H2JEX8_MYCMU|nr:NADH:flavin oxidoreductase [Mycolicibacterium mucogenicum]KAB7755472.1 N-methylproline demethylase [Mycolicibacterium mucogenicum DSM 44124]QPG68208.1 NADH:flavin oxidoreductase [Mycolicibacterium mucogenicum DSM 44124]
MAHQLIDPLLQPFRLKNMTLRNRVVSTSHEPSYTEDGMPKRRYRLYHEEKAKGGISLTMMGGSAVVAPDSPSAFGNLHVYKDEIVPWLSELAYGVHEHGAAVMCQITHLGRRTSNYDGDWLPVVYPSAIREPAHRSFPKVAEEWDMDRIVKAYADATERCRAAGLDGIELEAYTHLLDAFWSPLTNHRDDEYGMGSMEDRLRFPLRVIRAVREAAGPDFAVGIRMSLDEDLPGGLQYEDGIEIAKRLVPEGIDFISVIKGYMASDEALSRVIPPMGTPVAPHLSFAGQVKKELGIPVMHASRINDVATARHAIRDGLLDLVGMTRAHIADPHIVAKIQAGEEDRIRPCVGATYCLDEIYQNRDAKCVHNPSTGREDRLPHRVDKASGPARTAVVIGAGPAGLEAARVLGERGHRVVVFEASDLPGGQVRIASSSPRRRDLISIIEWRLDECKLLGVDIRTNRYVDVDEVLAENPDIVVVATGGVPNTEFLTEGANLVTDGWDVLCGAVHPRGEVMLYDDNGGHPGLDAAEVLARTGVDLEFVTPERTLAPDVGGVNYPGYFKVFAEHDVRVTLNERLTGVRRKDGRLEVDLYNEYAHATRQRMVDHVVVEHGTLPSDELYFGLVPSSTNLGEVDQQALLNLQPQTVMRNADGGYQLFRIGDAVASRNIHAAIYDAFRLCLVL